MLLFFLVIMVLTLIVNGYIRKNLPTPELDQYRHLNETQSWLEGIFLFLALVILFFVEFVNAYIGILAVILFGIAIILFGFRAFTEFKYNREEKEYLIHLIWTISYCISLIGLIIIFF